MRCDLQVLFIPPVYIFCGRGVEFAFKLRLVEITSCSRMPLTHPPTPTMDESHQKLVVSW